jgi:hypothetical protein
MCSISSIGLQIYQVSFTFIKSTFFYNHLQHISKPHKMVAFTSLFSVISMALFATTAVASPTVMAARQPPPTSSVIDFTLYKTTQPGYEDQCWLGVDVVHVSPNDLIAANGADSTVCNTADFYVLRIDHLATGYNCQSTSSPPYFLT